MITVLEHGALKINCPTCRARLQYEQEDIITEKCINGKSWIICPDCGHEIIINKPKTRDDFDLGIV